MKALLKWKRGGKTVDSDFLLIRHMKNGDDTAIESFVRKYYSDILRYCSFHIQDQGYAEDAVQEVFVRFFRTLGQYHHYGKAKNYLYVIAANVCKDHYRKQREVPICEFPERLCDDYDAVDSCLDIRMALEKLPRDLWDVTVLYYFQGIKQREISKILGIGLPLVKYRMKQAKIFLSDYLRKGEKI